MKAIKYFGLLLLILHCSFESLSGQKESILFSSWGYTWDSLCYVQDYYVFFPNSTVINFTMENNICAMGKYTITDSLVFMKFYCDERDFYKNVEIFDTVQYVAVIRQNILLLKEIGYWTNGMYKKSSYLIPENYIFRRKFD